MSIIRKNRENRCILSLFYTLPVNPFFEKKMQRLKIEK